MVPAQNTVTIDMPMEEATLRGSLNKLVTSVRWWGASVANATVDCGTKADPGPRL